MVRGIGGRLRRWLLVLQAAQRTAGSFRKQVIRLTHPSAAGSQVGESVVASFRGSVVSMGRQSEEDGNKGLGQYFKL